LRASGDPITAWLRKGRFGDLASAAGVMVQSQRRTANAQTGKCVGGTALSLPIQRRFTRLASLAMAALMLGDSAPAISSAAERAPSERSERLFQLTGP
jgi:hypothetical protein